MCYTCRWWWCPRKYRRQLTTKNKLTFENEETKENGEKSRRRCFCTKKKFNYKYFLNNNCKFVSNRVGHTTVSEYLYCGRRAVKIGRVRSESTETWEQPILFNYNTKLSHVIIFVCCCFICLSVKYAKATVINIVNCYYCCWIRTARISAVWSTNYELRCWTLAHLRVKTMQYWLKNT